MLERFIDLRHRVCLGYRRDRVSCAEIEHLVDDDRTAGWIATDLLLTQEKRKNRDFQRLGYETYLLKKPLRAKYLEQPGTSIGTLTVEMIMSRLRESFFKASELFVLWTK